MRGSIMKPGTISLDAVQDEPLSFAAPLHLGVAAFDREPLKEISPLEISGEVLRIDELDVRSRVARFAEKRLELRRTAHEEARDPVLADRGDGAVDVDLGRVVAAHRVHRDAHVSLSILVEARAPGL